MPFLLSDTLPVFDTTYFVWLVSRIAHVASAAILVGGLVYLRFVVAPQVTAPSGDAESVFGSRRKSWAMLVMITTLLLLLSGFYNLFFVIIGPNEKLPPLYHMLFGAKFLLALVLFFVAAALGGRSGLGVRLRASLRGWLDLAIVTALAIVVLAAVLRTIPRTPKVNDNPVATSSVAE